MKPLVQLLSVNEHRVFWDQDLKAGDRGDAAIRSSIKHSGIFVLFWCWAIRKSDSFEVFPEAEAPAPPRSTNRAVLIATSLLVVTIGWFARTIASRRRRASHALRITMDYLHRLRHGS